MIIDFNSTWLVGPIMAYNAGGQNSAAENMLFSKTIGKICVKLRQSHRLFYLAFSTNNIWPNGLG